MKKWPSWIPCLGSWMSAILLTLLTGSLAVGVRMTWHVSEFVAKYFPRMGLSLGVLAVLSPILLIAFAHHFLHVFLDRFFPETQGPEMSGTQGFIPGLMSWWEGLYGWLAIVLATLVTFGVLGAFFYRTEYLLYDMLSSWDKSKYLLTVPTIFWVTVTASLYQFEHLVRRRLMSAGAGTHSSRL